MLEELLAEARVMFRGPYGATISIPAIEESVQLKLMRIKLNEAIRHIRHLEEKLLNEEEINNIF